MWRQNPSSLCVCVIWICNNPKQNCERKDLKLQRKWTNSCCCTGLFKEFIFPENLVQKFRQMKKPKNLMKIFPKNFLFVFQSFGFTDFQTTKNKNKKNNLQILGSQIFCHKQKGHISNLQNSQMHYFLRVGSVCSRRLKEHKTPTIPKLLHFLERLLLEQTNNRDS